MKTVPKTKKSLKRTRSGSSSASTASIKLAHVKRPVLSHFRLIHHKHTGKLVHFRHTSHIALMGMLVLVGFFLAISQNMAQANGDVSVGLVVQGPGPTVGATIASPLDGFKIVNINPSPVSGTCEPDSFVVVYKGGVLAGSTICSKDGLFSVNVQLHDGQNTLTARNFDNLNQPGPDTPAVTVTFETRVETVTPNVAPPELPENPVIIPGVTGPAECEDYSPAGKLSVGGKPQVAVVCVPRTVATNENRRIGILVWGGAPPYALDFDWGSGESTLVSMDAPGYRTIKVQYASSGIYNVTVRVTDRSSSAATGQSAVEVVENKTPQTFAEVINSVFSTSWFETPVPLYVIAVGLTLGFWAGDIFDRRFGARKVQKRSRRA